MRSLVNGFRLETASQVREAMVAHPDTIGGELCGVPIHKRGVLLSPDETRKLRKWASENVKTGVLVMNEETIKALLQLVEVDPKVSPALLKLGDKHYASESNSTNRMLVASRLGSDTKPGYAHDMLLGIWGYADPMIIDALANIASAQHRGGAYLVAKAINPDLEEIEIPIMIGIPPQFVDFIDRGKSRTPKDMEFRDSNNFPETLISEVFPELPVASDLPKLRNKWSETLVSCSNNIYVRCKGQNVHPSKSTAPSEGERLRVQERFEDSLELQRLILTVYLHSVGPDGKPSAWLKVWSHNLVATAIVLASNCDHNDSDSLRVDWALAERTLQGLQDSSGENGSGPFGPALQDVLVTSAKIKAGGGTKPSDRERFGCLVAALGQFESSGTTDKVWLGARDRKKETKDKTFRCFGGVDCGYQSEE